MIQDLPPKYVEHLVAPVGVGDVEEANAAGEFGSMVGGLGVRVTLAYRCTKDQSAVIRDIKTRAFGSAAPIAPLSWLAENVKGQTWEEACEHTSDGVLRALCGCGDGGLCLPPAVRRSAEHAVLALRCALGVSQCGMPADPTGQGILVCRCLGVGDRAIRRAIQEGARDPDAVSEACGSSTGCGSCRSDIRGLIDEELGSPQPPPAPDLHPVERITLARGGPLLRSLGMPLLDARVRDTTVHLTLGTPEPGALVSPLSAEALIRHMLRETVSEEVLVEAVNGVL